jgi:hypothetical protein
MRKYSQLKMMNEIKADGSMLAAEPEPLAGACLVIAAAPDGRVWCVNKEQCEDC